MTEVGNGVKDAFEPVDITEGKATVRFKSQKDVFYNPGKKDYSTKNMRDVPFSHMVNNLWIILYISGHMILTFPGLINLNLYSNLLQVTIV